jgi:hypothetical protein
VADSVATNRRFTLVNTQVWPTVAESVNLDQFTFIDPFGLVLAACAGQLAAQAGRRDYRLPRDPAVAQYCTRMGLVDVLADAASLQPIGRPPPFRSFDRRKVLAELQVIGGPGRVPSPVADLVYERLADPSGPAEEAFCCIAEACNNVGEHAQSTGFAAAQVYKQGAPDERVSLAIADPGRGVARSLSARHGLVDHWEAVRLVTEQAASGTRDVGTGIASMLDIVDELGGTFVLWTGTAKIRRHRRQSEYIEEAAFPGTAVGIELPCRRGGR